MAKQAKVSQWMSEVKCKLVYGNEKQMDEQRSSAKRWRDWQFPRPLVTKFSNIEPVSLYINLNMSTYKKLLIKIHTHAIKSSTLCAWIKFECHPPNSSSSFFSCCCWWWIKFKRENERKLCWKAEACSSHVYYADSKLKMWFHMHEHTIQYTFYKYMWKWYERVFSRAHETHEQIIKSEDVKIVTSKWCVAQLYTIVFMKIAVSIMHLYIYFRCISLYLSNCVHSHSSLNLPSLPLSDSIEDHGRTSSGLSIVCILQFTKDKKKTKNICRRTRARTHNARFSQNFIALACD